MASLDDKTMKEVAIRLPFCISRRLGVLSREELMIKELLNEGYAHFPLLLTDPPKDNGRVNYLIGFVNWMLERGHAGDLKEYFTKKLEGLKALDRMAWGY